MSGSYVAHSTTGAEVARHDSLEDAKRWQKVLRGVIKQRSLVVVEAVTS